MRTLNDPPNERKSLPGVAGRISTLKLAQDLLGKSKARAGNDWCKRHSVTLYRDGKFNFVRVDDVLRALDGMPAASNDDESNARIAAAVARITAGRK